MYKKLIIITLLIISSITLQAKEKIVFGFPPIYDNSVIENGFKPLMKYLSKELNQPVELLITKDNNELAKLVSENKVQFGLFGGTAYVQAKKKYKDNIKYLATAQTIENGEKVSYYYGHIITLKSYGYKRLSDFKNNSFAYASKTSTSGYKFPRVYFAKKRIEPYAYFSKILYAGGHSKLTDMIVNRKVILGATYDINLLSAKRKYGNIFRTIVKLGPILNLALVSSKEVSDDMSSQLVESMMIIPPKIVKNYFPYVGFEILSDKDYDPIRDITFAKYTSPYQYDTKILKMIFNKKDLNEIYGLLDHMNLNKLNLSNWMNSMLVDKEVKIKGKVVEKIKELQYNDYYSFAENVVVLEIKYHDHSHKVYLVNSKNLEIGQEVSLKGKVLGQLDAEVVLSVIK